MIDGIDYNGRYIEIHYSKYNLIDGKNRIIKKLVKSTGISSCGDSEVAEHMALQDLIEKAIRKNPDCNLEKIIVIERNVSLYKNGKNIRYALTGLPIFEKRDNLH